MRRIKGGAVPAPTPPVILGDLTLSDGNWVVGTPESGTIIGATALSTLDDTTVPSGFTIDSAARTWDWDGLGTVNEDDLVITETLVGATNTPKLNVIPYAITAAPVIPPAPVLAWTSDADTYDPVFSTTEIEEGDLREIEIDDVNTFTSLFDTDQHTVTAPEALAGTFTYTGISTLPSSPAKTWYARERYQRGGVWSDWSNIVSKAMNASGYAITTVAFDGADRLARGANMTGGASSKVGMFSAWVKVGVNSTTMTVISRNTTTSFRADRSSNGRFTINGYNTTPTNVLSMTTNTTDYNIARGWFHVLASWDLNAGVMRTQLYVNGVDVLNAGPIAVSDGQVSYAYDLGVGATTTPGSYFTGELGDVYLNQATSLDLSVQANREKFILGGLPVDLGVDGSLPTGSVPLVYQSGDLASWHTNKGSGGGFTLTGALAAGSAIP